MVKFTFVFIDDFDVNIPELISFDEIKLKSNELKNGYLRFEQFSKNKFIYKTI